MAGVNAVHGQQHQRHNSRTEGSAGFQRCGAASALIPDQTSRCRQSNRQKGQHTAADVGHIALQCRHNIILPRCSQQSDSPLPFIAHSRYRVALQKQLHTGKIHAAAEIRCRHLCHRKNRQDKRGRRCCKADTAALFVLPHRHQRKHPEQQRIGAKNRFERAGRCPDDQPAGLAGAAHRSRRAYDDKGHQILHGLRCTAD